MSTIGDLTLNDIGRTRIAVHVDGAYVSGLLAGLEPHVETIKTLAMQGRKTYPVGTVIVSVDVTIGVRGGRIRVDGLARDTECEVVA